MSNTDTRQQALQLTGQNSLLPLDEFVGCDKTSEFEFLHEGTYSSDFFRLVTHNQEESVSQQTSIVKLVPVEGQNQLTYEQALVEAIIDSHVSALSYVNPAFYTRGFIALEDVKLGLGKYPQKLLQSVGLDGDESVEGVLRQHVDCSSEEVEKVLARFSPLQNWVFFKYQDGGTNLMDYVFWNAQQSFFMIINILHSLAVAEAAIRYEHRHLSMTKIMVSECPYDQVVHVLNGRKFMIPNFGISFKILPSHYARCDVIKKPVYLSPENDDSLVFGSYADIFLMMRDNNRDKWNEFNPKSNIFWVHYLLDRVYCFAKYHETASYNPVHEAFVEITKHLKTHILAFDSCEAFVMSPLCENIRSNYVEYQNIIF